MPSFSYKWQSDMKEITIISSILNNHWKTTKKEETDDNYVSEAVSGGQQLWI